MNRPHAQHGFIFLEWLIVVCIVAILSAIALPRALSLVYEWTINYEANCLLSDIRHIQMLSRTTQENLLGDKRGSMRTVPEIQLFAYGYRIDGNLHSPKQNHSFAPYIKITLNPYGGGTGDLGVIRFEKNGVLSTAPLTIRFMVDGNPVIYKQIIVHKSGRSRIEVGE